MSNAEIPTDNDGETDFVDDLMDMDGGKDALTMYGFSSIESRLELVDQPCITSIIQLVVLCLFKQIHTIAY